MIENMIRMWLSKMLFAMGRLVASVGFDIMRRTIDDAVGGKVRNCGCESSSPTGCFLLMCGTRGVCQCDCHRMGAR